MAADTTADEINSRFAAEQDYIARYVEFLHVKSGIHDRQITQLNEILQKNALLPLPTRRYDRIGQPFSPLEMSAVSGVSALVRPDIHKKIDQLDRQLGQSIISLGLSGPAAEYQVNVGEWVEFMLENLSDEPNEDEIEALHERSVDQAQELEAQEDSDVPWEVMRLIIADALGTAKEIKLKARIEALVYVLDQCEELQLIARIASPDAEISVFRQGFILLMTAFDAAVFDLVRVALRKRFFALAGAFGREEKISLHEIAERGSFESLREKVIEEQMKKRYVKDLLYLLKNEWKVDCVDKETGDKFERLIEFVLRRNVHVHNRGIVDERYLDANKNLDALQFGDVAVIDDAYWQLANRLTAKCVRRVAAWSAA